VTFAALQNMGKILSTNALYICPNHLTVSMNAEDREEKQSDTRQGRSGMFASSRQKFQWFKRE